MKPPITAFRGENRFLSNFYESKTPIIHEEISYPTVEHAFQAQKCHAKEYKLHISRFRRPGNAKRFGRNVELPADWDTKRVKIMETLIRYKFTTNENLRERLLRTEDAELIETNIWRDRFWGVYKGEGLNMLGKILMKIRDEILNEN